MADHGQMVDVSTPVVVVPEYGDVTEDSEGRAYLPFDFLPALVDKLPDTWYYATYPWFKYFDNTQRDAAGKVRATSELATVGPVNMNIWKQFVKRMFVKRFKEEGRLQYGKEMGKMAASESMKCSDIRSNGRQADTVDLVMKLLFDHIAPPLLVAKNLSKLIAYVWKWVYVPNLEGNVQWVKEALSHFFSIDDSRVVLSDKMVGGGRVHSVVKMFKKYGTQSAIRTLKNLEIKRWGFSIEVNKYVRKDNTMPRCADSERWAVYEIGGYLDDRTRNMMRRNGGGQFLVRHYRNVDITEGEVFKSNLHNAVQMAFNRGCDQEEVAEQLREVIATVEGGEIKRLDNTSESNENTNTVTAGETNNNVDTVQASSLGTVQVASSGGTNNNMDTVLKEDGMYNEDIENLKSAEELVDQLDDLDTSWAQTAASPVKQLAQEDEVRTGNTGDESEIVPEVEESLTPIRIGQVEKAAASRTMTPLFEQIEKAPVRRVSPRKGNNLKSVMMELSEKNVTVRVDI